MKHKKNMTFDFSAKNIQSSNNVTQSTIDQGPPVKEWSQYFGKFLTGKQSKPRLKFLDKSDTKEVRFIESKSPSPSKKNRGQTVEIKSPTNPKVDRSLQKLRNLITQRISLRKQKGIEQRAAEIRSLPFFKHFFYITQDYRQRILNQDLVSQQPQSFDEGSSTHHFKQMSLIFKANKAKSTINPKQLNPDYISTFKLLTKKQIAEKSQSYLQQLCEKDSFKQNKGRSLLKKQVNYRIVRKSPQELQMVAPDDKEYLSKLRQYQSFRNRASVSTLHNNKPVDEEDYALFKYINFGVFEKRENEMTSKTIGDFTKMIDYHKKENQKQVKPKPIQRVHYENYNDINEDATPASDTSSMHCAFESKMDYLYSASKSLQKQILRKQDGFGKRVRQLLKLNQLNDEIIKRNMNQLLP